MKKQWQILRECIFPQRICRIFLSRDQGEISIFPLAPLTIPLPPSNKCSVAARLFYFSFVLIINSFLCKVFYYFFLIERRAANHSAVIFTIGKSSRKTEVLDCENTWRQFLFLVRFFFAAKEKNEQIFIKRKIVL